MKIGGFVKQSLIDYPGKIAAVIFTMGCNFRCFYCHNKSLVYPELFHFNEELSEEGVINYLKLHKSWLDAVVITGGEPTIQNDLIAFIHKIKKFDFSVKLDTNGSNPILLKRIIDLNIVDYIAMDIKTIVDKKYYFDIIKVPIDDKIINNIIDSIKILLNSDIMVEFRTTYVPEIHSNHIIDDIKKQFNLNNITINDFRPINEDFQYSEIKNSKKKEDINFIRLFKSIIDL